jgi:hypothetical protein
VTEEELTAQIAETLEAEEARPQREADPHAIVETQNWDRYARALTVVVRRYGDQQAAEAWDKGHGAGWRDAWRNEEARIYNGRELDAGELTPNPYRAAALRGEAGR